MLTGVVRPEQAEFGERAELRELLELLDPPDQPALGPDLVALCEWIADYYVAPIGEVYRLALPASAMGVDARRARLSEAGRALWQQLEAAEAGPLLAREVAGEHEIELEEHDHRLLERLASERDFVAVARLSKPAPNHTPIPSPLKRLASLAERGLVEIDAGEAERHQARTQPHVRRTDRLRGASVDEPAIMQAVGRSKQRRALLDYLELQPPGTWTSLAELRGPFSRARALLGPLVEAGLVVEEERLRELDPFALPPTPEREPPTPLRRDSETVQRRLAAADKPWPWAMRPQLASPLHGQTATSAADPRSPCSISWSSSIGRRSASGPSKPVVCPSS